MTDWNPTLYSRFEDERTRPARDLLARVPLVQAQRVIDLGCGPGNSTELLVNRFPKAIATGTDNSEAMLSTARKRVPSAHFAFSDIATWRADTDARPDLIYANAVLQWLPDHATLIPRLFSELAPGGVLAIQMPDNREESTHRLMRDVAAITPWNQHIGDAVMIRTKILSLNDYYDLLAPKATVLDVWHTIYQHPMDSANAIVEWLKSTGLRPFIDALPEALRDSYLTEYERHIDQAYRPRSNGKRLLAFPRLFIVAQKSID